MDAERPKLRRLWSLLVALWVALSLGGLGLVIQPAASMRIHVLELLALAVFPLGALVLGWRRKMVRFAILIPIVVAGAALLLPGRAYDRTALRAEYVRGLRSYDGVAYVWGGEGRLGVDCSGLIRRGLMDACLREGTRTCNPALLRASVDLWWHDCSARSLGEGYRGTTTPIVEAASINALNPAGIEPGDLAVVASGAHILAYVGGGVWTQAAPEVGHAASFSLPSENGWFQMPAKIVRWRLLE